MSKFETWTAIGMLVAWVIFILIVIADLGGYDFSPVVQWWNDGGWLVLGAFVFFGGAGWLFGLWMDSMTVDWRKNIGERTIRYNRKATRTGRF